VRLVRLIPVLSARHRVMFIGKVEEDAPGPLVAGFTRQPAAAAASCLVGLVDIVA
jgi:hypothetical protein